MLSGGARKRERHDANDATIIESSDCASRRGADRGLAGANEGEVIEKEMKRLKLAKDDQRNNHVYERPWINAEDGDVDMDNDHPSHQLHTVVSPRVDYRPINLTLRECHYLRQLRKFQSERVSYLERRAPTDAAAAAVVHAMQARRR